MHSYFIHQEKSSLLKEFFLFQHITRESNIVLNVIFPSDVQEQHLYFLNPSGNVDAGIQVDVWVGSYIEPLYLK